MDLVTLVPALLAQQTSLVFHCCVMKKRRSGVVIEAVILDHTQLCHCLDVEC